MEAGSYNRMTAIVMIMALAGYWLWMRKTVEDFPGEIQCGSHDPSGFENMIRGYSSLNRMRNR